MPTDTLVKELRSLLDRLVDAQNADNEILEEVHDEVARRLRDLPRAGIVDALEKAVGRSQKRGEQSICFLSELSDVPEALGQLELRLSDPDPIKRHVIVQAIGFHEVHPLAEVLNGVMLSDPDRECRDAAVYAASRLGSKENLPALLDLTKGRVEVDLSYLCLALKQFDVPQVTAFLAKTLNDDTVYESARIHAAWALGKRGDESAVLFLGEHLERDNCSHAAEALCDILGWTDYSNRGWRTRVARTKERFDDWVAARKRQ